MPRAPVMAAKVTASMSANLPSQPNRGVQATLSKVGARRSVFAWLSPTARASPSPHDKPGLWQLAQERDPDPERRGSKNSIFPSSNLAVAYGLSSGNRIATEGR